MTSIKVIINSRINIREAMVIRASVVDKARVSLRVQVVEVVTNFTITISDSMTIAVLSTIEAAVVEVHPIGKTSLSHKIDKVRIIGMIIIMLIPKSVRNILKVAMSHDSYQCNSNSSPRNNSSINCLRLHRLRSASDSRRTQGWCSQVQDNNRFQAVHHSNFNILQHATIKMIKQQQEENGRNDELLNATINKSDQFLKLGCLVLR